MLFLPLLFVPVAFALAEVSHRRSVSHEERLRARFILSLTSSTNQY